MEAEEEVAPPVRGRGRGDAGLTVGVLRRQRPLHHVAQHVDPLVAFDHQVGRQHEGARRRLEREGLALRRTGTGP